MKEYFILVVENKNDPTFLNFAISLDNNFKTEGVTIYVQKTNMKINISKRYCK